MLSLPDSLPIYRAAAAHLPGFAHQRPAAEQVGLQHQLHESRRVVAVWALLHEQAHGAGIVRRGEAGSACHGFRARGTGGVPRVSSRQAFSRSREKVPGGRMRGASEAKHARSEEHTSELQSLMRISYAVFCLKKKKNTTKSQRQTN